MSDKIPSAPGSTTYKSSIRFTARDHATVLLAARLRGFDTLSAWLRDAAVHISRSAIRQAQLTASVDQIEGGTSPEDVEEMVESIFLEYMNGKTNGKS